MAKYISVKNKLPYQGKIMKRLLAIFCVCFSISVLNAQKVLPSTNFNQLSDEDDDYDDDDDGEYDEDNIYFDLGMNLPGDQFIRLSLGLSFPLNFPNFMELFGGDPQLNIGGMGSLGYHYLLSSKFAIGFDVGFGFNVSIGSHIFNYVPFTFALTYQPVFKRFEFPLTLGIGFGWESFGGKSYFPGLVIKPEVGAMFRLTESWSFGMDLAYLVMPEFAAWYHDDAENFVGQFAILSVTARYHF